jgi:hypothetical protein
MHALPGALAILELAPVLATFDEVGKNRQKLTIPLGGRPDVASDTLDGEKSEGCVSRWNVWVDLSIKQNHIRACVCR